MPGKPTWRLEREAWRSGYRRVAGLDEAGRGCLAGPVVAAAAVLDPSWKLVGVDDSKPLGRRKRERLYEQILRGAWSWSVALVCPQEIDRTDILSATLHAMGEATRLLPRPADFLLVDALELRGCGVPYRPVIGGDRLSVSIAAASIIAKVTRDTYMEEADSRFPGYGFALHKGYGTRAHLAALRAMGITPLHRRSFSGVGTHQHRLPFRETDEAARPEPPRALE